MGVFTRPFSMHIYNLKLISALEEGSGDETIALEAVKAYIMYLLGTRGVLSMVMGDTKSCAMVRSCSVYGCKNRRTKKSCVKGIKFY